MTLLKSATSSSGPSKRLDGSRCWPRRSTNHKKAAPKARRNKATQIGEKVAAATLISRKDPPQMADRRNSCKTSRGLRQVVLG